MEQRFEEINTALLQEAYSFSGPSDAVTTIWSYISMQNKWGFAQPVYSVGDRIALAHALDEILPVPVGSFANHESIIDVFGDLCSDLMDEWDASGDDVPTRIISRYDVTTENLNVTFRYEPIPRDEKNDTWSDVFRHWVDHLRRTGDDAA